jgi:hypothetical protein
MTKVCKICNKKIPIGRINILPTTSTCVDCSSETKYSAVAIIHHKTGNEVQIVKNADTAKEFVRLSKRSGFGTLQSISATKSRYGAINQTCNTISKSADFETFNKIGEEALFKFELKGLEYATKYLDSKLACNIISRHQYTKILQLIQVITTQDSELTNNNRKNTYIPVAKASDEILNIFKHWKL